MAEDRARAAAHAARNIAALEAKRARQDAMPPLSPCARELRIAQRLYEQASYLRRTHGARVPGVDWRLEDAQNYAEYALDAARVGRCAGARVDLKHALRVWRQARLKAEW